MYYVYVLSNPLTSIPFYVGVGKQNRCSRIPREQQHIVDAIRLREGKKLFRPNKHKLYTILNILDSGKEVDIKIVAMYELEKDAFNEEIRLIAQYGRKDLGKGPLTNLTDSGEGGVNPSPETTAKISYKLKGRPSPLKGRETGPLSDERKQKISDSTKGRKSPNKGKPGKPAWNKGLILTEEQRKNMGPGKGRVPWNKGKTGVQVSTRKGKKGPTSPSKGKPSGKKGMTYEEIYGPEKAAEIKEKRRLKKIQYWEEQKRKPATLE